ncbi:MAG TPA: hypothetical protein VIR30_20230 [Nocardioides sp.]
MSRRTLTGLVAVGISLAFLAGCGDSGGAIVGKPAGVESTGNADNPFEGKSSQEIQELVTAAMAEVESVRVSADLVNDGSSMTMVMSMDRDSNCDGSLSMGGGRADIKGDTTHSFMKGDRAFWIQSAGSEKQAEPILKILGDKWVRTAAGSDDGFSDVCDLDGLLDEFESSDPDGTTTVGAVSTVDGVEVVELSGDGDGDGDTTRMWVSVSAPHRIVKMKVEGGDEPGEFHFSKFNEPIEVDLPGDGEWVDLNNLGG